MIEYSEDTINEINNSVNLLDYISQFTEVRRERNRYFCLCPFHQEKTPSFMIDQASNRFYCFGCRAHGGVIKFIMMQEDLSFNEAIEKLSERYGLSLKPSVVSDTIKTFRLFSKPTEEIVEHRILSKNTLKEFSKCRIVEWEREGIKPEIMDKYDIRIDTRSKRIVYPVYDNDGNLINIKGRTMLKNWKELKLPKYINYYKVGTLDYLQGLCFKKEIIQSKNEVIIFEGVKSCLKAEGWGFPNVVSSETAALNIHQIKALLRLHCDVVIAYDKDKSKEEVLSSIGWLPKFTNVYIINDTQGLLGDKSEKNSPVDKGEIIWRELYDTRERV